MGERRAGWASTLGLGVGSLELLSQADKQEWAKDRRDQREVGMGKYLFIDPREGIWLASGESVRNGGLKNKVETGQHKNGRASQAGGGDHSRSGGAPMGDGQIKSQVHRDRKQNHDRRQAGILP